MHRNTPRKSRTPGRFALRLLGRLGGVGVIAGAIAYGAVVGGHVDLAAGSRVEAMSGDLAGYFGYAAQEIRISGLEWQSPPAVLAAVGVTAGGPLVGFQPAEARRALEGLDWVESARVQRLFPNQLEISVVERQPFAVCQRGGMIHVIDQAGMTLTGVVSGSCAGGGENTTLPAILRSMASTRRSNMAWRSSSSPSAARAFSSPCSGSKAFTAPSK